MRLTYKYENDNGYGSVKLKNLPNDPFVDKIAYLDRVWEEERNKLGQLEDIEEELGIDLATLFKALKYGVFTKNRKGIHFTNRVHIGRNWIDCLFVSTQTRNTTHRIKQLKDYGKTWALTKEELE